MNTTHVAAGAGVFAAVLVACFVLVGFDKKPRTVPEGDPAPEVVAPPPAQPEEPTIPLPTPKSDSAAVGGFGELARFERGFDGTAAITRSSESADSEIAAWKLPEGTLETLRDVRLNAAGTRLVTVSDTGVRVFDTKTGYPVGDGISVAKDIPATALSPNGDWAVQASVSELKLFDTGTGTATTIAAKAKRTFSGAVQFGPDNGWCAVLGKDDGVSVLFRVNKGGKAVEALAVLGKEGAYKEFSRIERLHTNADGSRMVFERPSEKSPDAKLSQWNPPAKLLVPLPGFAADVHDSVKHFRLSGDGKRAVAFDATKLKVFDLDGNRTLLTHVPENLTIGNVAFVPAGDRLVVAYDTRRIDRDADLGSSETTYEPGYVWVLDLGTKSSVGSKLHLEDLGIPSGFRRFVLSGDGSRVAILDARGKVHLIDADRAFGAGTTTAKPAAAATSPAAPTSPTNPTQPKRVNTDT